MEYKIIHNDGYLLVVDDSEIKIGNYYLHTQINKIFDCNQNNNYLVLDRDYLKKIISHLPLNNSPILEGVDLLPPLEDDSNKYAYDYAIDYRCPATNDDEYCKHDIISAYNNGYSKAKETYKYTDKQLNDAIIWGINYGRTGDVATADIDKFIQSLNQPRLPKFFECEMEILGIQTIKDGDLTVSYIPMPGMDYTPKPKTITNSQGQTVWVGTYK